jgi:hypothetical protein
MLWDSAAQSLSPPTQAASLSCGGQRGGRHGWDYVISGQFGAKVILGFYRAPREKRKGPALRILFIITERSTVRMLRNFNARACACSPAWNLPFLSSVGDLCNCMPQLNIKSQWVQIQYVSKIQSPLQAALCHVSPHCTLHTSAFPYCSAVGFQVCNQPPYNQRI